MAEVWNEQFETDFGYDETWTSETGNVDPDKNTSGITGASNWGDECLEATYVSSTQAYITKTFGASKDPIYIRFEFIVDSSNPIESGGTQYIFNLNTTGGTNFFNFSLYNVDGSDKRLYWTGSMFGVGYMAYTEDTLYVVECMWNVSGNQVIVNVNDVEKVNTDLNGDTREFGEMDVGIISGSGVTNATVYFDNVMLNDAEFPVTGDVRFKHGAGITWYTGSGVAFHVLLDLGMSNAWHILTASADDFAWHIQTALEKNYAWHILTDLDKDMAWHILNDMDQDAAWHIQTDLTQSSAWHILTALAKNMAWHIFTEFSKSSAWHILTAAQKSFAWHILTSDLIKSFAWDIRADRLTDGIQQLVANAIVSNFTVNPFDVSFNANEKAVAFTAKEIVSLYSAIEKSTTLSAKEKAVAFSALEKIFTREV